MQRFEQKHSNVQTRIDSLRWDIEWKIESSEYLSPDQIDKAFEDIAKIEKMRGEVTSYIGIVEKEREKMLEGLESLDWSINGHIRHFLQLKGKKI